MIRRPLALSVATSLTAALLLPLGAGAASAADEPPPKPRAETATSMSSQDRGPVVSLGKKKTGTELYIVQLDDAAVPTRHLNRDKGASTQRQEEPKSYEQQLVAEQADLRSSIRRITGAAPQVRHSYTQAMNGIAVRLTREQARKVARLDGIAAVQVDKRYELQTDVGPEWIGAPSLWDGSNVPGGVGSKGEGVLVGIIDSGINPANPSFHDSVPASEGGDGYDHTNPLGSGNYVGMCNPTNTKGAPAYVPDWGCNDKLIGYYNFTTDGSEYDDDGHGTHTGSTAAGNQVDATTYSARGTRHEFSATENIKGVAPHANVIGYDVCDGGCSGAAIVAAIEQSIIDGVDVINYSIGSPAASNPWTDVDAVGFLNARAAGIHVATSAGNDGPGAHTLGSPADIPWITSVGATQHDRQWQAHVTDITADGGATHPNLDGVAFAGPTNGPRPLVDGADLGSRLCLAEELAGQDLTGQIVVCERGTTGRVEKGEVVSALGADGMILVNDAASGNSINADAHALPAVHLTHADGMELKQWMGTVTGEQAALSGGQRHQGDDVADIMAGFSSRGPNRAVSMIGPSVSAPGVDILAAAGADNSVEWHFISGTSMASPHTAGALALLKGVQDSWTPAEAQSALMTTAVRDVTDTDGSKADWHDMGSGRIDLTKAAKAGLVLDESEAAYLAADPTKGGDVRTLNTASMADNECLQSCSWTRTLTGTSTGAGTWGVSVQSDSGQLSLAVDKSSISVTSGGDVDVTVTATVAGGASTDTWLYGTLVLTPPSGSSAPEAHLPIGVLPSAGVLPEKIEIPTRRDAGSQLVKDLEAIAISNLQVSPKGLVPGNTKQISIPWDDTNDNPYDGNGVHIERITVPEGASMLMAKYDNATAPDLDMYVGRGAVSAANEVCYSASAGSAEKCEIANPEAGDWWILTQNWESSTAGGTDTTDLTTAVVAGNPGNLRATGPTGAVEAATPFDIRVFWDEDELDAGETWYGSLTLGSSAGSASDIGVIPVEVHRMADDVTKTADVETAKPGDVVTYTVKVEPNVTPEDQTYTIKDTLPAGTTYVDGSATNGATYANGVVSWQGTLPTSYGKAGSYDVTTSGADPSCVNPFSGAADYTDLEQFGIAAQAGAAGDTQLWNAFGSTQFGFHGETYSGVGITDDGFLVYDPANNYAGEPWVQQTLPDPAAPNNLAAGLWQDMEVTYDAATNKGLSLANAGDLRVVEWDDVHVYGEPGQSYDMQAFLVAGSQDIVFAYDNIKGPLGAVTIGAENVGGTAGDALVNNGNAGSVISNGTVVCMTYQSAQGDPVEFSYQVKVGTDVHNRQQLVNSVEHTTSNPGAKPATTSATVTVTGALERSEVALSLNPDRIETGEGTQATATVFSAGEAVPTGEVQFMTGTTVLGKGTLDANGRTTATLSGFSTAGVLPITARYLGDAANRPSTSAPVNLVVEAPGQPIPKVGSKITIKGPKKIKRGKRAHLRIVVSAKEVTPSGKIRVRVRGAVKRKYTLTLNSKGIKRLRLPKAKRVGKIRVDVRYLGDAAVNPSKSRHVIRVRRF